MTDEVEQYFIDKFIPYKKNISITTETGGRLCTYHYLLPQCAIFVNNKDLSTSSLDNIFKRINMQIKYLPQDYTLYFYYKNITQEDDILFDPKIKLISHLDQIKFKPWSYHISHPFDLRCLVSIDNPNENPQFNFFKDKEIIVSQATYLKSISLLGPNEMKNLSLLSLKLNCPIPTRYILISTKNSIINPIYTFIKFHIKIYVKENYFSGYTTPTMYIPGITYQCTDCCKILQIEKKTCFCKHGERVKKNPGLIPKLLPIAPPEH